MKFSNRENELVTTTDDRKFFISRSVAVVPHIVCLLQEPGPRHPHVVPYVLLDERGPGCPDHVGMWVLPAGYLDWDESGNEAAIRETWEECGFDILAAQEKYHFLDDPLKTAPWQVVTRPRKDSRQNVVLHYGIRFEADKLPNIHADNNHDEVTDVKWVRVTDAVKMELAFKHHEAIAAYAERYLQQERL